MFGISISFLSSLNMFNLLYTTFLPGQILRLIQKAFLHFYPLQQHLFTPAQVTLAQPYQLLEEDLAEKKLPFS